MGIAELCGNKKSSLIELKSPAKINLFLSITGKRDDGYHLLFSLMSPIKLYDTLRINPQASEFQITCHQPHVPSDESNLAMRAARIFYKAMENKFSVPYGCAEIYLDKHIPVGAGLGGGSSNAATVLLGLNHFFGHPFDFNILMSMALELGADVPFFVNGKPAVATGIGERLENYLWLKNYSVLLIYPGFSISTAKVYKNLNLRLTKCQKKINKTSFKNEKFSPGQHMCNDLEDVAITMHPELSDIKHELIVRGASGALMSGSGSSVFGLFTEPKEAQTAYEELKNEREWQVYLVELLH